MQQQEHARTPDNDIRFIYLLPARQAIAATRFCGVVPVPIRDFFGKYTAIHPAEKVQSDTPPIKRTEYGKSCRQESQDLTRRTGTGTE